MRKILVFALLTVFLLLPSSVNAVENTPAKTNQEILAEYRAEGKKNTEILIIAVSLGLTGLVAFGYGLQKIKPKKVSDNGSVTTDTLSETRNTGKKKASKKLKISAAIIALGFIKTFTPSVAYAICPVCLAGVAAGVGLAEVLRIDDVITGAWLAGMGVSVYYWTVDFMNKRKWSFKFKNGDFFRNVIVALVTASFVVAPIYYGGYITWHYDHVIAGIDKMILGPVAGTVFFVVAANLHYYLRRKNNAKAYFPFQKVVIPIGSLLLVTIIFYFVVYYFNGLN